jgi:hypothetical protein
MLSSAAVECRPILVMNLILGLTLNATVLTGSIKNSVQVAAANMALTGELQLI